MRNKKIIFIISSCILVLFAIFYFDSEIAKMVFLMRSDFLDNFFIGIINLSSKAVIFFFLTSLFLWKEYKRKWILPLWFTLGLSTLISFLLKFSIQRLRPFQLGIVPILPVLEKASHLIWDFSFPSFHAMLVFCAIPILSKEFPKFKYIWIIFGGLIAFSRIYFGLHFLSDIIAGGLIGYLLGVIIIKMEKENKFWERIYNKIMRR